MSRSRIKGTVSITGRRGIRLIDLDSASTPCTRNSTNLALCYSSFSLCQMKTKITITIAMKIYIPKTLKRHFIEFRKHVAESDHAAAHNPRRRRRRRRGRGRGEHSRIQKNRHLGGWKPGNHFNYPINVCGLKRNGTMAQQILGPFSYLSFLLALIFLS